MREAPTLGAGFVLCVRDAGLLAGAERAQLQPAISSCEKGQQWIRALSLLPAAHSPSAEQSENYHDNKPDDSSVQTSAVVHTYHSHNNNNNTSGRETADSQMPSHDTDCLQQTDDTVHAGQPSCNQSNPQFSATATPNFVNVQPQGDGDSRSHGDNGGGYRNGDNAGSVEPILHSAASTSEPDSPSFPCSQKRKYTMMFTITFDDDDDDVYIAYSLPYTYTQLQQFLRARYMDKKSILRRKILCRTLAGNRCDMLTITSPVKELPGQKRPAIILSARVHPGESTSSWVLSHAFLLLVA